MSPQALTLVDVAEAQGVAFAHGAFRWDVSGDRAAMMGGGVCWLDVDGDGRLDLYAVNSYAELESRRWDAEGERPVNRLFRNDGGGFADISVGSGADLAVRGEGCVAADFDLDGATDLYVTTARGNSLLWGDGDGTFTEGAEAAGVDAYGWFTGAAVGDVDGDGWPDLFVSGYVNVNQPDSEVGAGVPQQLRGRTRPALPQRGPGPRRPRHLPGGGPDARASIPTPSTASERCSPMSTATTTSTSTWPTTPTRAASTSTSRRGGRLIPGVSASPSARWAPRAAVADAGARWGWPVRTTRATGEGISSSRTWPVRFPPCS